MVPELAPLWAPNRLSNWSFLTYCLLPSFWLKPLFLLCFLYKFLFKMLKFEAQFWSKFQTLENQLNCCRAVLWTPNCPSKFGHEFKQRKRKTPQKKTTTRNPNASFCRKKRFSGRKGRKLRFFALGVVGLSVAKGL